MIARPGIDLLHHSPRVVWRPAGGIINTSSKSSLSQKSKMVTKGEIHFFVVFVFYFFVLQTI